MLPLRAVFAAQQFLSLANNQTCKEDKSKKKHYLPTVTPTHKLDYEHRSKNVAKAIRYLKSHVKLKTEKLGGNLMG